MAEMFDIVDERDQVIGQAPRCECHGNPALVHRVAHVLVFNSDGNLLLQLRAPHKDVQPGKWDTSVGGHLDPGEGYRQAAVREMGEELGVHGVPLTFLYKSRIRNEYESENVATYLARYDGLIRFAEDEISEIRFWTPGEIDASLGSGLFTPNFEEEWAMFRAWAQRSPVGLGTGPAFCAGDSFPDAMAEIDRS